MSILRNIWAIYGILIFFALWVVLFPFYFIAFLIFPTKGIRHIIWFSHHIYTRVFFTLVLIRIKVEGRKLLSRKENYIIISNHRSSIDFMINANAFPGVYKFLAKSELVKVPLFGMLVKRLCVLVDRKNSSSRLKSIENLKETLMEGYSVFIYPEGTRNRTENLLGNFHKGAFRIAIETQTPLAIQTIVGIENVSAKAASVDLCPGNVKVIWSEPIPTKGLTQKDIPDLVKQVRKRMELLIKKEG